MEEHAHDLNKRIAQARGWRFVPNPDESTLYDIINPSGQMVVTDIADCFLTDEPKYFRLWGKYVPDWTHDLNAAWNDLIVPASQQGMQIEYPLFWDDWSSAAAYATWLCEAWLAWHAAKEAE